ncbi:MAG: sigma-70 family RNA polymerase sigma factor [Clostridia bacterium]|nr:sigma-70 family RNA polymerase sigma factor [Clostridia bacterium]
MKNQNTEKVSAILSDEKIIELYWERDERAISATDAKYKSFLLTIAYNIIHDDLDCEECLNDTYLGAWNSMPPSKPAVLPAFLSVIMRRHAINRYNANMRKKRVPSEMTDSLSEMEDVISHSQTLEDEMAALELANILNSFVRSLSSRQRYIFIGRYYFAEPIDSIANDLGVSKSTVNKEIATIKTALKENLEREGYVL